MTIDELGVEIATLKGDIGELKTQVGATTVALIRLEPTIKDVDGMKKWQDGTPGSWWPGAQFQIRALWTIFIIFAGASGTFLLTKIWEKIFGG